MTPAQHFAIQAKLNMALGATEYDRLFLGMECGPVFGGVFQLFVPNEYTAGQIDRLYRSDILLAAESVLGERIASINVLPKDFSDAIAVLQADA